MELNAFDLLKIGLVHGWLLEPDAQEYEWVGENTYNQLVNLVIEGNDASARLQQKSDSDDWSIIGIDQGRVVDPGEVGPESDTTFKKITGSESNRQENNWIRILPSKKPSPDPI